MKTLFDDIEPGLGESEPAPERPAKKKRARVPMGMRRREPDPPAFDEPAGDELPDPPAFHARDYQEGAVDAVFEEWRLWRSTLVVLATGGGKTPIATKVARRVIDGEVGPGGFLFLTNKDKLCDQAVNTFRRAFPRLRVEREQASRYATADADIVVGSVQTMWNPRRLAEFPADRFAAIGIDEAHHAKKANRQYANILNHFARAVYFGLTATPRRSDGVAMGEVFDTVAVNIPLRDMVRAGWLVRPYQVYEEVAGLVLPELPPGKDWTDDQIAKALKEESGAGLYAIASAAMKWSNHGGKRRRTVVFAPTVDSAILIRDILNRHHAADGSGAAEVIHAKVTGRESIYEAFSRGDLQYLVNNMCLTEGFDDDGVSVVVIGRMTNSEGLYVQMCGRPTRPIRDILDALAAAPDAVARRAIIRASRKPGCLIVDVRGNTHKLGCSGIDVLDGRVDGDVKGAAVGKPGVVSDLEAEMLRAEKAAAEQRRLAEERRRVTERESLRVKAELRSRFADPFDAGDVLETPGPDYEEIRRPTDKQADLLRRFGMCDDEITTLSSKRASAVLDIFFARAEKGLCSYKMSRILVRHGHDPNLPMEEASRIIAALPKHKRKRRT